MFNIIKNSTPKICILYCNKFAAKIPEIILGGTPGPGCVI